MMFNFVVKYMGSFKHIPGMGFLFDCWLKIHTLATDPNLFDHIDNIEQTVQQWEGVNKCFHKYGGVQFNYYNREIGHIHSNGLLDILLSRQLKQQLMLDGKTTDHHVFKYSGWISFYIKTEADKDYALRLFELAYNRHRHKNLLAPGRNNQTALPAVITVLA